MSSSNSAPVSDSENEYLNPPVATISEDSEEEPFEDFPEEPHPVSPVVPIAPPSAQPERIPSFRSFRNHPNGPRMLFTPRKRVRMPSSPLPILANDPYLPPPPTAHRRSDTRSWDWVLDTITDWRREEGNPYRNIGVPPFAAWENPVTGEPPQHTIPLLIARIVRHEAQIESLETSEGEALSAHHYEEIQNDHNYLRLRLQGQSARVEDIKEQVEDHSRRISEIERRVSRMEELEAARTREFGRRMTAVENRFDHIQPTLDSLFTWQGVARETLVDIIRRPTLP